MEKVRIYYDAFAKTLTVWLDNPQREEVCEEADDDTVFMKDANGKIIGFEMPGLTFISKLTGADAGFSPAKSIVTTLIWDVSDRVA